MGSFLSCGSGGSWKQVNRKAGSRAGVLWSLIVAPVALSGCVGSGVNTLRQLAQVGQEVKKQQGEFPVSDVSAVQATLLPPNEALLEEVLSQPRAILTGIKPSNSGPGLIIVEPEISAGADGSTPAFGAGCGRWLHLATAGLPQFGKTPSWFALDYAFRQMGKKDGRVSPKEAVKLAKILAVTHVATGVLSGNEGRSTLTYRLWKMPENKLVGAPIILTGSRVQIASQLPVVAKTLAERLNGDVALVPAKMEVSAAELERIGSTPRYSDLPLDDKVAQAIKPLAARSPLAGMEYVSHLSALVDGDDDASAVQAELDAAKVLLRQAPKNTLVLAQVALTAPPAISDAVARQSFTANNAKSHLNSYAESIWHSMHKRRVEQRKAAERSIANAPGSAWAWLQLGEAFSDEAEDVRNSHFFNEMTTSEQDFVSGLYPKMVQATLQAVRCDRLNAQAWQHLSGTAAFDSDDELADAAFWKAMSLPAHGDSAYRWGLQLYQPKWQGNSEKLRRVASLAMADEARFVRMYAKIVQAFNGAGRGSEASQYEQLAVTALTQWLQAHPEDNERRADFAQLLRSLDNYKGAAQQFEILIQKWPNDDDGYHGLALVYEHENNWDGALENYLKAIAVDPQNSSAWFRGGQVYHQKGQYRKAEPMYDKAIALDPEFADPYNRLADLHYFVKNDRKGAEQLYRKAVELDPGNELFNSNLKRCLAQ